MTQNIFLGYVEMIIIDLTLGLFELDFKNYADCVQISIYKDIMSYIYYMEILNILYCPIFLKKCMSYIYYMKSVIYYLFPISKKNLSGHVVYRKKFMSYTSYMKKIYTIYPI